jgi:DNA repair protein RadC
MKTYKTNLPEITLKYKSGDVKKVKITCASDAAKTLKEFYDQDTIELTESVIILFLNRNNNTIGWYKVSQGGLSGTVIDNRLIIVTALNCAAHSIIISHNHPSGNTQPSQTDILITTKLKNACDLLDIKLLDHIILTESGEFYSMADNGVI